jgi:hypothetical protein
VDGLLSIELIESTRHTAEGRNDSDESLREVSLQLDGNGSVTRTGDTGASWDWTDADGHIFHVPTDPDAYRHADSDGHGAASHTDRHTDRVPADLDTVGHTDGHTDVERPPGSDSDIDTYGHADCDGHSDADGSTDLRRCLGRDQDRHDWKGPKPDQQPEGQSRDHREHRGSEFAWEYSPPHPCL